MLSARGRRGANTGQYAGMVEQILLSIGVDPALARMNVESGFGWNFKRGSALIEIYIAQAEDTAYFQVLSPLLHLPLTNLLPLYRRLLEVNLQITNAAFGVYQDIVYIFSERRLEGMDAQEANTIINMVAQYADEFDDRLLSEFGGRLYNRI
ncbi:MAG: YbjN domain-containing protein [Candidatus Flexifilum sp.]